MAGVPEKVLNWLYSVLTSEYADVNRTYHDAAETLSNYPSLSPRTEVYTYENGASALLLLINGTVPVTFRSTTYGFPVHIWVPHAYPRESPIVYVKPSQDMLVRPGQHVSGDGRVYHPYLAQWGKYWDKSTIFDFLAVLRGVFAKEPPVRSKQPQQQHYNTPTPPPVPPPPVEWRNSTHGTPTASPAPGPSSQGPAPPPKPPKPYEQNTQSPAPPSQHDRYSKPPPLPPHPSQQPQHPTPQQYQQPQRNSYAQGSWQQQGLPHQDPSSRQASYDMHPATPVSKPHRPQVQAQGYPPPPGQIGSPVSPITPEDQRAARYHQQGPPPQQIPNVPGTQQYQQPMPQPQQYANQPPQPPYQHQQPPPHYHQAHPPLQHLPPQQPAQPPPPPQPPVNLLDDPLDVTLPSQKGPQPTHPAPPIPPNPEKDALLHALSSTLASRTQQTVSQNSAAIAPLLAQQSALHAAHARLQAELDQLVQLDAALASNEAILRDAMREADRVMEDARRRAVPDVDDVLVAPTVVGGQLYALAAEERALGEALFVLGKAVGRGRVGCETFVKQTRSLAREQFLKRALIKKIARGMGLDEYGMR